MDKIQLRPTWDGRYSDQENRHFARLHLQFNEQHRCAICGRELCGERDEAWRRTDGFHSYTWFCTQHVRTPAKPV